MKLIVQLDSGKLKYCINPDIRIKNDIITINGKVSFDSEDASDKIIWDIDRVCTLEDMNDCPFFSQEIISGVVNVLSVGDKMYDEWKRKNYSAGTDKEYNIKTEYNPKNSDKYNFSTKKSLKQYNNEHKKRNKVNIKEDFSKKNNNYKGKTKKMTTKMNKTTKTTKTTTKVKTVKASPKTTAKVVKEAVKNAKSVKKAAPAKKTVAVKKVAVKKSSKGVGCSNCLSCEKSVKGKKTSAKK